MSRVSRLLEAYTSHIGIPWREDAAPAQRVIFCVYDEGDELRLRAKIEEFELATRHAGHGWAVFDMKDTFAEWLGSQRYAAKYFEHPDKLRPVLGNYLEFIIQSFQSFVQKPEVDKGSVVALVGVGSLFGFHKVKGVVDKLAPHVPGRLLVFFPGSYEDNNYRLLDGYDGWNYLAVPITARGTE